MKRNFVLACILQAAFLTLFGCRNQAPPPQAGVPEVAVVEVRYSEVPINASYIARAQSSHQVEVMARVSGFLNKIAYTEGGEVEDGQVMFRIDPRPLEAQVQASRSEVQIRTAQLWVAQTNLDRVRPLAEQDAASKSDLDNAVGSVNAAKAALAEAQARQQKAELDLSYATISSPITGMAGQSLVREGSYITATGDSAHLTYVAKLDPIWVEFSVSQNEMDRTREQVEKGTIRLPETRNYVVEIELANGKRYPHTGKLNFADPSFNQQTGTFLVRAEIPNPEKILRPGMFLKVWLHGASHPQAIVIPQKAVLTSSNGHIVLLAGPSDTVEPRPVVVGDWLQDQWIINEGLHPGDRVIVEGLMRLTPGMPVKVVPAQIAAAASN